MKPQEFFDKYNNKKIDYDGRYGNQCVDSFNQYLVEVLGISNPIQMFPVMSAYQIWDYGKNNPHFTRIENTPTGVPQQGDIIIWANDKNFPDGHVAIFQSGDVNSFVSFDQNYPMGSLCHFETHNYSNPKVIGWLRPKKLETEPTPTKPPFIDLVQLWTKMDGNKTYAAVVGMFLTILAYNLGYITEEQFSMLDTLFLALMGFSLRDAIKKK
jgi:hypothetical protein